MTLDIENLSRDYDNWTRRERIAATLSDLIGSFLYYDRKECQHLPVGAIEDAIIAGEVSVEEVAEAFGRGVAEAVDSHKKEARR